MGYLDLGTNLGTTMVGTCTGTLGQPDYEKNPATFYAGKLNNYFNQKLTPQFGGKFDKATIGMYITKVIYNNPVTIVFWSDNTKTMCRCQEGDTYNKELGLSLCVLKKLTGSVQVANLINDWVYEDEDVVDLKMVRFKNKKHKDIKEIENVVNIEKRQELSVLDTKSKHRFKKKK